MGSEAPHFKLSSEFTKSPSVHSIKHFIGIVKMHSAYLLVLSGMARAAVSITDPSDVISPALWADDNAIVPNYSVPFISVQPSPIIAAYAFEGNSTAIDHETFSTALNQTSVILAADGAELNLSYVEVVKSGYASNLLESSFYGFNAAINIVS